MKYAVIRTKGHQYKVQENDEILVDHNQDEAPEVETLLMVDGDDIKIGTPLLTDIQVKTKVLGQEKGEKIDVRKYHAKSRSRRHVGFRPIFTKILIESIKVKGKTKAAKSSK